MNFEFSLALANALNVRSAILMASSSATRRLTNQSCSELM